MMAADSQSSIDAGFAGRVLRYLPSINAVHYQLTAPHHLAAYLLNDKDFVQQVSFDATKNSVEEIACIIQQYVNSQVFSRNTTNTGADQSEILNVEHATSERPAVMPPDDPGTSTQERGAAKKGRLNWSLYETEQVNEQMKQHEQMLLDKSTGIKFRTMSAAEKFHRIAERLAQLDPPVNRTAAQIETKWERLAADFKKVWDWDKSTPSGQPAYWDMPPDMKKDKRLPPTFSRPLFLR
jgi:hypothetical protein